MEASSRGCIATHPAIAWRHNQCRLQVESVVQSPVPQQQPAAELAQAASAQNAEDQPMATPTAPDSALATGMQAGQAGLEQASPAGSPDGAALHADPLQATPRPQQPLMQAVPAGVSML